MSGCPQFIPSPSPPYCVLELGSQVPRDFRVWGCWLKAKQQNAMGEKFVSGDRVAKIKKREADIPHSKDLGRSPRCLAPRQPSVQVRTGLQTLKSVCFLCVLLRLMENKIKSASSFRRSLMCSPKETCVLLQKTQQLARRFQRLSYLQQGQQALITWDRRERHLI